MTRQRTRPGCGQETAQQTIAYLRKAYAEQKLLADRAVAKAAEYYLQLQALKKSGSDMGKTA